MAVRPPLVDNTLLPIHQSASGVLGLQTAWKPDQMAMLSQDKQRTQNTVVDFVLDQRVLLLLDNELLSANAWGATSQIISPPDNAVHV